MNHRVFVSTHPFGAVDNAPIKILQEIGLEVIQNPIERKLTEREVSDLFFESNASYLIAGTEKLGTQFFKKNQPKAISRVGVGYDSIDLDLCRKYQVPVFYTPDAPRQAVVDQAIASICHFGQSLDEHFAALRKKIWIRKLRRGFPDLTVGIIGFGRIGSSLAGALNALECRKILVYELVSDVQIPEFCEVANLEGIFSESDVVCIHASREPGFDNFIGYDLLSQMRSRACLINLARGELVDEHALYQILRARSDLTAYVDVFKDEPYTGLLTELSNCFCTPHLGSMTPASRIAMETTAAKNIVLHKGNLGIEASNIVYLP